MRPIVPVVIVFLLSGTPAALASMASFTPLGDLPGGLSASYAYSVSADGLTVVGQSQSDNGSEAFVWTADGGMIGLGDLPGGEFLSLASGISADGSTVVGASVSSEGQQAFRWTAASGMIGLGDLPGGNFNSEANGVSADGLTVVGQSQSANGYEAFAWTAAGGMAGLGQLPGNAGFYSVANAASADGLTIAGYSNSMNDEYEAFAWTAGSGMVGLGDLPGEASGLFSFVGSYAYGVSADGLTIVGRGFSDSGYEAFAWTADGGMTGLGDLPGGGFSSEARAVSADGTIVVGTGNTPSDNEAFIWSADGGMRSVAVELAKGGVDLAGWRLISAYDVSADGRTIVGYGTNPSGNYEAWIATLSSVPEPASVLLACCGLLVATCCRNSNSNLDCQRMRLQPRRATSGTSCMKLIADRRQLLFTPPRTFAGLLPSHQAAFPAPLWLRPDRAVAPAVRR
ncbi:MAG: HAF repeat/PEP-CTERM domain-containing protein [Planctomycetaceae bacterium]|nr:HAF repeat/PEP-CTERM domain-containing protein [Planctomycetaceae bacterium]